MNPEQLNYHHLRYFWEVARQGRLRVASQRLRISQPTISAQIRALEEAFGADLFIRSGRGMILTDRGRLVMDFANDIFTLGSKLVDVLSDSRTVQETRLYVGVTDTFAKLLAFNLIRPAFKALKHLHLTCTEGTTTELLGQMATGRLDVILADEPAPASLPVKAYSHRLGEAPTVICGTPDLVKSLKKGFPHSINGAPILLPFTGSAWRNQIDLWMETNVLAAYGIEPIGQAKDCHFPCYMITVERAVSHTGAQVIAKEAKKVFPKNAAAETPPLAST
jgi:LysR family transcriptional activator of nhaA